MQRWDEGESIVTSYIVKLDEELGNLETRNTVYDLGEKNLEATRVVSGAFQYLREAVDHLKAEGYTPKYSKSVTVLI